MMGLDTLFARLDSWNNGRLPASAERPLITLSYAQSLDGSIAARADEPLALSSPESLHFTHRLRAAHDAILVGIGAVLADNPRLTARLDAQSAQPQPVVLDSRLRIPLDAALWQHPRPPWIAVGPQINRIKQEVIEARGARVMALPRDSGGGVDLGALLAYLHSQGVRSVMVEGGGKVITQFLAGGWVDLLALTITPLLVGGLRGVSALPAIQQIVPPHWEQIGRDMIVWGEINDGRWRGEDELLATH